jgi:tetratricopeptide (TPR) repeat protein
MSVPPELHAPTIRGGPPRDAPSGALPPGSELAGRYRILELVGEGGMGIVYRARDLTLDSDVALKILHPRIAHDPAKLAFFRNEVRVARKVTHPNVCRLHDLENAQDGCFITMEYIAGEPLSARLARGTIEPAVALRVLRDVASGLAAAHAAGVIHRDLKPSNVLLAGDRAVVADFGIAGEDHALGSGPQDVAGTRGYMAPEQATGAPLDARADVYALGVLAFALATGRRPPPAVTHTIPAGASAAELPIADLETQLAALPSELAALIRDCLALLPDARPRDAGAVLDRLDALSPSDRERSAAGRRSANGGGHATPASSDESLPGTGRRARSALGGRQRRSMGGLDSRAPAGRRPWLVLLLSVVVLGAAAAAAIVARHGEPSARAVAAPRIALTEIDATALAEPDRWLAAAVRRLIADEIVDAWGMEVELAGPGNAAAGTSTPDAAVTRTAALGNAAADTVVIATQLLRARSGRLRLVAGGETLEASTPRELAAAAARRIVQDHVAEPLRHPTAAELAAVGAHDAEAWRLWRRAQHETLLLRGERANALCQEARARDPEFPLPTLELALGYDDKDVAGARQLAAAVELMNRVPVRPLWPLVATGARQLIDGGVAGATRTVEQARRLDLAPRERLWLELRWAMAIYFTDSPQAAAPALELLADTHRDHPSAFKLLAGMHLASDQPTAPTLALRYATRATELAPEDGGARADLATALLLAGRRDEASALAAELAQLDPEDKRLARGRLFTLHMALGDVAEAELDARRQLSGSASQRAEGTSGIALIDLYWGRFDTGVRGLLASADAYDAIGATVAAARTRCIAGRQARLLGERTTAIAAFQRVAAGPTHYAALAGILAPIVAGKLDDARARAAAMPGDPIERASADLAIADAAHDPARVLAAFARVENVSAAIEHLFAVAEALERSGRRDEAAKMFERIAGNAHAWIEPIASTRAWYRLGRLRERAGDAAGARAAFGEVLRRWGNATARTAEVDDARRRLRALSAR